MTRQLSTHPSLPPAVPHDRFVLPGGMAPVGSGRLTPPVGFPHPARELLMSCLVSDRDGERAARAALSTALGVPYVFLLSTGRAGMALLLASLHAESPNRDEVVLPAYGCFSLPSSIVRAGLRIRLVDLARGGFELDRSAVVRLLGPRTLAVIVPHLLGYPLATQAIADAARQAGAVLIDDAAQALGASRDGTLAGTAGTAGILSFGRGKPLSAMGGGAIVTRDATLAANLERMLALLPAGAPGARLRSAGSAALSSLLLDPRLFGLVSRVSWLKLGCTEYDPAFPLGRLDGFRAALIARGWPRLAAANAARARHADAWRAGLHSVPGWTPFAIPERTSPVELRLPILTTSGALRERALVVLRTLGIGASRLYPAPLTVIPALARHSPEAGHDFPWAQVLADRLLCLPTYPYLNSDLIAAGCAALARLSASDLAPDELEAGARPGAPAPNPAGTRP
jgi:perosamine synthetase